MFPSGALFNIMISHQKLNVDQFSLVGLDKEILSVLSYFILDFTPSNFFEFRIIH